VVDPDALDKLVSSNENTRPSRVTVTFEYAGLKVVVRSTEVVYAMPIADAETILNR
jgi:hypothetical protein